MNNYTTQCLLTIGKALDWTDQRFLMVSCHLYEITQGSVHQELHLCDPTHMLHLYRSVKQRQPVGGPSLPLHLCSLERSSSRTILTATRLYRKMSAALISRVLGHLSKRVCMCFCISSSASHYLEQLDSPNPGTPRGVVLHFLFFKGVRSRN